MKEMSHYKCLLTIQALEYEYDAALEPNYRQSLIKSFKKQVDNLLFNFIIVDAVFDKVDHFEEIWSYAKSKGFQVGIISWFQLPIRISYVFWCMSGQSGVVWSNNCQYVTDTHLVMDFLTVILLQFIKI